MLLSIELNGRVIERDTTKLPVVSVEYMQQNGFSQRLRDSYASVTEKKFPNPSEREAARNAKIDEVLEQFDTGNVPGTRAPTSPAKKLANTVATAAIAAGVDPAKIDPEKLMAYLQRQAGQGRAA